MKSKLLLALLCVGALVGCGKGNTPASSTPTTTSQQAVESGTTVAAALAEVNKLSAGGFSTEKFTVVGYVLDDTPYFNSKYNSYSFEMADTVDGTEKIKAYSVNLATGVEAPQKGDKVTVNGYLTKYEKDGVVTPEIAGNTDHEYPVITANVVSSNHQSGGNTTTSGSTTTVTPTLTGDEMKWPEGTTTNMTKDGSNNAATVGLDESKYEVTSNGDASKYANAIGLNKDGTIRIYNGNVLTIKAKSGNIAKIALVYASGYSGLKVFVGDQEVTAVDGVYTINAATVEVKNDSGAQIRLTSIIIQHA